MRKLRAMAVLALLMALSAQALGTGAGAQSDSFEIRKDAYRYKSANKRDPFVSIVQAAKLKREKEASKGLFPLEEYDLSQMKVRAIIKDPRRHYALVTLPDGKSYTVTEGMSMGIHGGTVQRITLEKIVVREMVADYKGVVKPLDTVLRLRSEEVQ
ncbi:MAG: pilus assembly protein PilP [Nitrospirota bacterium]|jgi:Tfp pilus assembly protein PilP